MIVTSRISARKLLAYTWQGLLLLSLATVLACVLMSQIDSALLRALSYAAGFLGTALAFLIGFRNNHAYGRWWEAQRVWSKLKYESRSFALRLIGFLPEDDAGQQQRRRMLLRQIAFAWWLNRWLRKLDAAPDVVGMLDGDERAAAADRHTPPLALLETQARELRELAAAGRLEPYAHVRLAELLDSFNAVLGSCERLKKTPFPMQYTWFVQYTLVVFLLVLPLSLAGHLGLWSIPFSLLIGYAYIMLEYVGRHIETPFENAVNDVPMDYLSRAIEIDLRELLGDRQLPAPVQPQGLGYLY